MAARQRTERKKTILLVLSLRHYTGPSLLVLLTGQYCKVLSMEASAAKSRTGVAATQGGGGWVLPSG